LADARFYKSAGPFSLTALLEISGADLVGTGSSDIDFSDIETLATAHSDHVSFIDNRQYVSDFEASGAGVIFIPEDLVDKAPESAICLKSDTPYLSYSKAASAFYPDIFSAESLARHENTVSGNAKIGTNVTIGLGAVIMEGAEIGDNSVIGPNAVVGAGVVVGENSWIGSNTTLQYCYVGRQAIIHPGARIGQDGYGFAPGMPRHFKVPQLGRVMIGDDVEIGANTCIDRGSLPDTVIGGGTKLDNLVHIAHNVTIGEGCFITGQVGIAGSSHIGNFVMMGGQAGISGHLDIGDRAKIAAQAGVSKDIEAGETVAGYPAMNARKFWKNMATLNKISEKKK